MTDAPGGSGQPDVAAAIREGIARGDFAPNQRLVEADLAELFGASRSGVRSALIELTNEGLVERVQHRGARVRAVTLDEAVEISEVRMAVEGLCAAKAAERVTDEEIAALRSLGDAMRAAVADGHVLRYSALNKSLHQRIVEISGQETAAGVLRRLRAQAVRFQFRLALVPGRPNVSLAEHLAIIDEICAHSPNAAEQAARRHLESVINALKTV
ncbi:GntR family transcriptional regulator [Actinomadura darangshiensis]|uniref:GntR family transcriptional regulator n=2 Tax=Actinomadura darangshiensis TaxID=705336 RepID=A0A4R5B5N8_9ACTN|nr:GntR family transcriptional regulator [Actinomadura darangshiensis]